MNMMKLCTLLLLGGGMVACNGQKSNDYRDDADSLEMYTDEISSDVVDTIRTTGDRIGDEASDVFDRTKEGAKEAAHNAKEEAEDAADKLKRAGEKASHKIGETADKVADGVKESAQNAKEEAKDAADKVKKAFD